MARFSLALGWPLDVVKRHTLRELNAMHEAIEEREREQKHADAMARARKMAR